MMKRFFFIFFAVVVLGCQPNDPPYVIMLWTSSELLQDGETYPIHEKRETVDGPQVLIEAPGGEKVWVDGWRVLEFPSLSSASAQLPLRLEQRKTKALGSRLWQNPDPYSGLVTVLGSGKEVRVLTRSTTAEGRSVSWTEVLSSDGNKGWIPTYMLENADAPAAVRTMAGLVDAGPWKPGSFNTMLESGRLSVSALREDLGLTLVPEEGRLTLQLMRDGIVVREDYRFLSVNETADSLGFFLFEGAIPFRIQWIDGNRLTLFLPRGDQEELLDFVTFSSDPSQQDRLSAALALELAQRNKLWETLALISTTWRSAAYGLLEIHPDGRFRWEGPDRLLPYLRQLIQPVSQPGTQDTDLPLPDSLAPWFGSGRHGGYETNNLDYQFEWEGTASFDIFVPRPRGTVSVLEEENSVQRGLILRLNEDTAGGLAFAAGLERRRDSVQGLILVPLPPQDYGREGASTESLPDQSVTLYFEPSLDE